MILIRWLLAWLAAVMVTSLLGSVIQTQFNLSRLSALGAEVSLEERMRTTLFDLASFAPTWAVIVALALLLAFLVAAVVAHYAAGWRTGWMALAGFAGVAAALLIMDLLLPVTPLAAARTMTGFLTMSLAGAVGGWVYAGLNRAGAPPSKSG